MLQATKEITSLNILKEYCWGGALATIECVENAGKGKELIAYLDDVFQVPTALEEINDFLHYEEDQICQALGIRNDE